MIEYTICYVNEDADIVTVDFKAPSDDQALRYWRAMYALDTEMRFDCHLIYLKRREDRFIASDSPDLHDDYGDNGMTTSTIKTIDQEIAQIELGNHDVRIELLRERNKLTGDLPVDATGQELEEDHMLRLARKGPSERAEIWLRAAPYGYQELYDSTMSNPGDWTDTYNSADDLVTELEWLAVKSAMIVGYVGTRAGLDGTGQHSHEGAVKGVNKLYKKIRGIFGYNPDSQSDYMR